ncbi:MAG: transketolase [Ruminococcaceae bacterium]|nr:transketolase [Oscillospiraceae bacterium]
MGITSERKKELSELANQMRIDVLTTLHDAQTGHPGGSLSVCEILIALFFEKANVDPKNPKWPERDRVVLTKGHAAPMLYRVLAEKGFFPVEEMKTLRKLNTRLQGHPSAKDTPGVELSTGPLGIGLSACLGMATGLKLSKIDSTVFAVMGDGELNEGTNWEAFMSAPKFKADNLIAIVDYNQVQLDGTTEEIMPLGDLAAKFRAFNWEVSECDGHDIASICDAVDNARTKNGLPKIIIAHTVKGKGVSFMEGDNSWHGKPIGDEEFAKAMQELGGNA